MKLYRWIILALMALYLVLLIPGSAPTVPPLTEKRPFAWNQDEYWSSLQNQFKEALQVGCPRLNSRIDSAFAKIATLTDSLNIKSYEPDDPIFAIIETTIFELGTEIGVCRDRLPQYMESFNQIRSAIKTQSTHWDMNSEASRIRLYRFLYGGRAAIEQVMLQLPSDSVPALSVCEDVPSATPSTTILGVTIHSGDILVSRGGAPTSALIARGNDFQGNFSHVALVYVDSASGKASIIESHIEQGIAIATLDDYLRDTKLRVMVLRLRPDLLGLKSVPMLPGNAAAYMLERARSRHIPYDFQMDFADSNKLFCSEVASQAYRHVGLTLWMGMSHISSPGIRNWLGSFGVTHFETQEPSDLEYDPQLKVVAEWRDPKTLARDQIDNAIIDVMLEFAEMGVTFKYSMYLLPVARTLKAYSVVLNWFGGIGPVPEGMDATAALRNKWFSAQHAQIKELMLPQIEKFKAENGYAPPYWELVKLARQAKITAENR
ncbi:MAG: YiiX/YebB-like N1pC/P60 family cysteine hydrolase [candidate division Zixibacteria bacterium]|nr:YiiX/YebB-like N1pC/P60 family cysteine hydrolase [candidate division Zixibacteria bacterium]